MKTGIFWNQPGPVGAVPGKYGQEVPDMSRNTIALIAVLIGAACLALVLQIDVGDRAATLHPPAFVTAVFAP